MRAVLFAFVLPVLAACAPVAPPEVPERRAILAETLPPMKTFAPSRARPPARTNREISQDFLELSFQLESGRVLPVFTRFEEPVTVRIAGQPGASLVPDLDRLIGRIRREAGIDISRVAGPDANITIEVIPRDNLRRAVPQAACFVVPRLSSWNEFLRRRRSDALDWRTLERREKVAIFIPGDVSPQEVRDCLHEELAQALGPLNDLYRLSDSVFNDDNFHNVLTGFDMVILRAYYDPALRSGMSRSQVAERLPDILARINPRGQRGGGTLAATTPREWIDAIETALGPGVSPGRRRASARRAVEIAERQGWRDNRLGFSLFALGRLSLSAESDVALASFLQAGAVYAANVDTRLHAAHVAMQLSAFALSAGQATAAIRLVDENIGVVSEAENAALLATLLMIKAEALILEGREAEARAVRLDSLGWARYGFGSEAEVRQRLGEIALLSPRSRTRGGAT